MGLHYLFNNFIDKVYGRNRNDWYEAAKNHIVHHSAKGDQNIYFDDIVLWKIHPEMLFDVIEIQLRDGSLLCLKDYKNDLVKILLATVGDLLKG